MTWPLLCFISSMRHPFSSKLSHFQVLSKNSEHCKTKNSSMHGYFLHSSVPVFIHALFSYGHSHVCVKGYRTFTLIHAGSWQSSTSKCLYPLCQYMIQQGMISQYFTQLCMALLCISTTKNSYFHTQTLFYPMDFHFWTRLPTQWCWDEMCINSSTPSVGKGYGTCHMLPNVITPFPTLSYSALKKSCRMLWSDPHT